MAPPTVASSTATVPSVSKTVVGTATEFFAGVNTQALINAQGLRRDPQFLRPSSFRPPLRARFTVRWLF